MRRARELKEAKAIWAKCGYPRIVWQSLHSRLHKFSKALGAILNKPSISLYRKELESKAVLRKKDHRKYLGIGNATAGYYGPRGQTIL